MDMRQQMAWLNQIYSYHLMYIFLEWQGLVLMITLKTKYKHLTCLVLNVHLTILHKDDGCHLIQENLVD